MWGFLPSFKHTPIPHFSGSTIPHTHSWGFALFTKELITIWQSLSHSFLGLFVTGIITDQLWEIWGSINYTACFICWPGCLDLLLYSNILCKSPATKGDGKKSKAHHSRCDWVPNHTRQQTDLETPSQANSSFLTYWCLMNIYLSSKQQYMIYILLLWRHAAHFSPLDFDFFFSRTQLKSNPTHKSQPVSDMQQQYGNTWATFPMPLQLQQN